MTFGDAHGHPGCHGCQMCFATALHDELLAPGGPEPTAEESSAHEDCGELLDDWGRERDDAVPADPTPLPGAPSTLVHPFLEHATQYAGEVRGSGAAGVVAADQGAIVPGFRRD